MPSLIVALKAPLSWLARAATQPSKIPPNCAQNACQYTREGLQYCQGRERQHQPEAQPAVSVCVLAAGRRLVFV